MAHDRTSRLPGNATRYSQAVARARLLIEVGNSLRALVTERWRPRRFGVTCTPVPAFLPVPAFIWRLGPNEWRAAACIICPLFYLRGDGL